MVDAVTLGYVAGDVQHPERKLQLEQAAGVDSRMRTLVRELQTIASLAGCGRKVRRSAAVYGASTVSAAFGM